MMVKAIDKLFSNYKKWYAFLIALAFVLYGNTLKNGYAIDDHYVTNNDQVKKGIKAIPGIFSSYYAQNENNNFYEYRPLVKASFAIEYQFFGNNVTISHFINIVLYGLLLIILFRLISSFLPKDNHPYLSHLIIIFFAVLPLHTEVVASLKNRDILLCFIFAALAIIITDNYIAKGQKKHLAFAFLLAFCSFLSKVEAAPFIAIAPVLLLKKHRLSLPNKILVCCIFIVGYTSVETLRTLLLKDGGQDYHPFYNFERPEALYYDMLLRIKVGFICLGYYLKSLVFPSNMACYYGMYTIPLTYSGYFFTGVLISIVLACIYIKDFFKPLSNLFTGITLFILPVSIYLQVAKPVPGIIADRFTFFASLGFSVIIISLVQNLYHLFKRKNREMHFKYLIYIFIATCCIYIYLSINRNKDWKNNLTLYQADVQKWPSSVKLNTLYANEILDNITKRTGRIKQHEYKTNVDIAYKHMFKAYCLEPSYYNSLNTLAYIDLSFNNQPYKALYWLKKAQKTDTINYEIPLNICLAYQRINNPDSLFKYYKRVIDLNPLVKEKLDNVLFHKME